MLQTHSHYGYMPMVLIRLVVLGAFLAQAVSLEFLLFLQGNITFCFKSPRKYVTHRNSDFQLFFRPHYWGLLFAYCFEMVNSHVPVLITTKEALRLKKGHREYLSSYAQYKMRVDLSAMPDCPRDAGQESFRPSVRSRR